MLVLHYEAFLNWDIFNQLAGRLLNHMSDGVYACMKPSLIPHMPGKSQNCKYISLINSDKNGHIINCTNVSECQIVTAATQLNSTGIWVDKVLSWTTRHISCGNTTI